MRYRWKSVAGGGQFPRDSEAKAERCAAWEGEILDCDGDPVAPASRVMKACGAIRGTAVIAHRIPRRTLRVREMGAVGCEDPVARLLVLGRLDVQSLGEAQQLFFD